jgi:hypothetical protein
MPIYFSINKVNRTVTLHKQGCSEIPQNLQSSGCGSTGSQGNHLWLDETHVNKNVIDKFMNNRFWAILNRNA